MQMRWPGREFFIKTGEQLVDFEAFESIAPALCHQLKEERSSCSIPERVPQVKRIFEE
jgi:hypothetical protein